MGVLGESWCFCNGGGGGGGGGKSERMKGSIFCSKGSAMARVFSGTGFLIHRNLLLTTHINLPSVTVAEGAEIRLQDNVAAKLVPHRFFITSSVLDLTIVGLDAMDVESTAQGQQPHFLKTCSNPTLDLGSIVYLLGHTDKKELTVGEGKVVIATDNLIKLSTDGVTWSPGSAGFDVQGNLAFMVCDPMKLASSPTTKSSSTSTSSSSSWKKDHPMQFGIPIPIICDWLNQHWEGSLDELNKPKLPLIRLMSAGQKSEHSCASFTLRRVFKSTEGENDETPSSSHIVSRPRDQAGPSCSANICQDETPVPDIHHEQGIPTPEIYESRNLTSVPSQKKENNPIQLLDINFPPKVSKSIVLPLSIKHLPPNSDENVVKEPTFNKSLREENIGQNVVEEPVSKKSPREHNILKDRGHVDTDTDTDADAEIISTGSVNGDHSEVQSSSYPVDASNFQFELDDFRGDYSSGGETTMYSAETMESRNYTSPREEKFQQVGRSQSCVNYNRWGSNRRNPVARKSAFDKQQSFNQGRKTYSQGAASQRSHDYYSPTVSSIMKKRNSSEPQISKPRQSTVQLSPRWV